MDEIRKLLWEKGTLSTIGNFEFDVDEFYKPYYERYLRNRDGFLKMINGSIDFVGSEDIMRLGPFHNLYSLVCNTNLMETDLNHSRLLDTVPFYTLRNGEAVDFGWSGSILAERLNSDINLSSAVKDRLPDEEVTSILVKVSNYACIIESRAWDPIGFVGVHPIIEHIAKNVKRLLNDIHLGDVAFN
jgi:hypothetical protein